MVSKIFTPETPKSEAKMGRPPNFQSLILRVVVCLIPAYNDSALGTYAPPRSFLFLNHIMTHANCLSR